MHPEQSSCAGEFHGGSEAVGGSQQSAAGLPLSSSAFQPHCHALPEEAAVPDLITLRCNIFWRVMSAERDGLGGVLADKRSDYCRAVMWGCK